MRKLLLRPLLAAQELHVVDDQHGDPAIALPELLHLIPPERHDHVVQELLRGDARHAAASPLAHGVGDRRQQVRLSEPERAVDEERVVALPRRLHDGLRRLEGTRVALADDEGVEREARRRLDRRPPRHDREPLLGGTLGERARELPVHHQPQPSVAAGGQADRPFDQRRILFRYPVAGELTRTRP